MTAINKNNYEIYFLDYIEGRLNDAQTAALMQFLDMHPDLRDELDGLEVVTLSPADDIRFEAKNALKKPMTESAGLINEENYEEYFAAASEGDLNEKEGEDLSRFLEKNPSLRKEYEIILQCRLQPVENIVYHDKASLKKSILVPLLYQRIYYHIAVAASLALLIGLAFLLEPGTRQPAEIAHVEEIKDQRIIFPETDQISAPDPISDLQALAAIADRPIDLSLREPDRIQQTAIEGMPPQKRAPVQLNYLASLPAPRKLGDQALPSPSNELRTEFSDYFPDVVLAQIIRHAEEYDEDPFGERLLAHGTAVVREIFQPGEAEADFSPPQVNLWQIADVGINGFARLTGADLEFRKKTDNEGKVIAFAIESQSLQISRNLRRK